MEKYKICEIFHSIQGEGFHVGESVIFIRFYGCNRQCTWCDEPKHTTSYEEMDYFKIKEELDKYPDCSIIVITGGEPSLQNLNSFIRTLQRDKYWVCVETNGFNYENIEAANWITFSPKDLNEEYKMAKCGELKIVVEKPHQAQVQEKLVEKKVKELTKFINKFSSDNGVNPFIYIQPMSDGDRLSKKNMRFCVEVVKKIKNAKISIQLHKVLEVR